jgi:hypothetical protein
MLQNASVEKDARLEALLVTALLASDSAGASGHADAMRAAALCSRTEEQKGSRRACGQGGAPAKRA